MLDINNLEMLEQIFNVLAYGLKYFYISIISNF